MADEKLSVSKSLKSLKSEKSLKEYGDKVSEADRTAIAVIGMLVHFLLGA